MPLALRVVDDIAPEELAAPKGQATLADAFDRERQRELFQLGVRALEEVAENGNDNAKMGAARSLVELFRKQGEREEKPRKVQVSWRNPSVDELLR